MATRRHSPASRCARALWLLGLTAPVTDEQLTTAWRARVGRTHPDRHNGEPGKLEAATLLTSALNDARAVVADWIASGRPWPTGRGELLVDLDGPDPWPVADEPSESEPDPAPVCRRTGLRAGDRARVWPFVEEPRVVAGTESDGPRGPVWVRFDDGTSVRSERVRPAAFGCPVCGLCAGPAVDEPTLRPCPACLVDLRSLERRPTDAGRIRTAIESRAEAGRVTAAALGDVRLEDRARERGRWSRRLRDASPEDLRSALLEAFTRAFERWSGARAEPARR